MEQGRSHAPQGSSNRAFGLVFTAFFTIVGLLPLVRGGASREWALVAAGLFGLLALIAPAILAPLNRLWTRLGLLLNRIASPIVLGLLFYLMVMPMGLFLRAMGKDPLRLRFDRRASSYWIARTPPGPPPESMRNQY